MRINKNIFLTISLLVVNLISCQSKKVYTNNFDKLSIEKKQEVKTYLDEFNKTYPKKDNEIILMLSYECFLNKSVIINKKISKSFNEDKIHGGHLGKTAIITLEKNLKRKIELSFSDGKKVKFSLKDNYDYISICYSVPANEWYIEYYDYPQLYFSE
ncbi:hypothetical protein [Chryseobacterium polytrichastri]|uniref:Uncharacterized protein n=1 Tax=Chryseobacterium polytrichastri TaxID=1302687 RepID=A0A1M7KJS0_9FLAO|nr:hypothetical protein [Chryseobacterium polytrichastri]SHM65598.1 hypothetical protein SAMN05444267_10653 [Chryseobacterium polytrichastri]